MDFFSGERELDNAADNDDDKGDVVTCHGFLTEWFPDFFYANDIFCVPF